MRLFLILVAMVGCGRFANLSFVLNFLHFWQWPISSSTCQHRARYYLMTLGILAAGRGRFRVEAVFVTVMRVKSAEAIIGVYHAFSSPVSEVHLHSRRICIPLHSKVWIGSRCNDYIPKCQTMLLELATSQEVDRAHVYCFDDQTAHQDHGSTHADVQATIRRHRFM